jgi:hypothetical protein
MIIFMSCPCSCPFSPLGLSLHISSYMYVSAPCVPPPLILLYIPVSICIHHGSAPHCHPAVQGSSPTSSQPTEDHQFLEGILPGMILLLNCSLKSFRGNNPLQYIGMYCMYRSLSLYVQYFFFCLFSCVALLLCLLHLQVSQPSIRI